jgi:sorbitol/mannitol transport system substrate-binding protein
MKVLVTSLLGACALAGFSLPAYAETTLTIATVNNSDMIRMQTLTDDFTKANPDIKLNWVTLEENVLRQKVTTDIATKGGQFDVLTIGTYEVPIWGKKGWLVPLDKLGADYDVNDLLPAIRSGLTVDGKLYAAPFYGESSMVMYRKDLMEKAGLKMPESPTWAFIKEAADKMTDKANEVYGICLRGKAGWGENMALLTAMSNSFGARWFDEKWNAQFNTPEWKATLDYYVPLMKADGPGFQSRQRCRLRARAERRQGQERQLAMGVVAGRSRGLKEDRRRREVRVVGDEQAVYRPCRVQGRLGERAARHADVALQES